MASFIVHITDLYVDSDRSTYCGKPIKELEERDKYVYSRAGVSFSPNGEWCYECEKIFYENYIIHTLSREIDPGDIDEL